MIKILSCLLEIEARIGQVLRACNECLGAKYKHHLQNLGYVFHKHTNARTLRGIQMIRSYAFIRRCRHWGGGGGGAIQTNGEGVRGYQPLKSSYWASLLSLLSETSSFLYNSYFYPPYKQFFCSFTSDCRSSPSLNEPY